MAQYSVAITKQTLWHGVLEEYDNVYTFEGPADIPDAAGSAALINAIANAEKQVHGTGVEFMRGRMWTSGGTVQDNVTIALIDLDGTGVQIGNQVFKEAAVLVEWECDRMNVLGRKVYLRKYLRIANLTSTMSAAMGYGEQPLTSGAKSLFKTYADTVQTIAAPAGVNYQLKSDGGRLPRANNNGVVNNFMISREFRRN